MPDNLWDKSDMFELLLSVVSLLVTDYHKTWPPVSAWWQCGCRQPPATTHLLHCPLFLARFYSAAHTRPVCPLPIPIISLSNIPITVFSVECSGPVPNLILMIGYCWPWLLSWTSNIALLKCSLWRYTIRVSFSSLWFRLFYFAASLTSVIGRC